MAAPSVPGLSIYQRKNGVVTLPAGRGGLSGFFLTAFAISWLGAAPMVLSTWSNASWPGWLVGAIDALRPLQVLMYFGPLLATLFAIRANYGWAGLKPLAASMLRWRVHLGWYLAALLGPVLIVVLSIGFSSLIGGATTLAAMDWSDALLVGAATFTVYLVLNTEEFAWRGFALARLQCDLSPLRANLLLSAVWAVFHGPLFLVKGGHPAGYSVWLFLPMVLAIGLILGALFNATRGSVLIAHLVHQSFNGFAEGFRIFPVMQNGSSLIMNTMVSLLCVAGLCCAVWLHRLEIDKRSLE